MLAAILFSTRFATQSSRILRLETGKELLALGTNFSLLFLPIFAYFRKNKRNVTSHFLPELVSSRTDTENSIWRLFSRIFPLRFGISPHTLVHTKRGLYLSFFLRFIAAVQHYNIQYNLRTIAQSQSYNLTIYNLT